MTQARLDIQHGCGPGVVQWSDGGARRETNGVVVENDRQDGNRSSRITLVRCPSCKRVKGHRVDCRLAVRRFEKESGR